MANINIPNTKKLLEQFEFEELFNEELGWEKPPLARFGFVTDEVAGEGVPIAQLGGVMALEVTVDPIPDAKERLKIHRKIRAQLQEHVLIFVDRERTSSCWSWVKVEDKKEHLRDHFYFKGESGDAFISKIANLAVDLGELDVEGKLNLVIAAKKVKDALDVQRLVKRFYDRFKDIRTNFVLQIEGIEDAADQAWYASVVLNRLMFIYFLQKGGFIGSPPEYRYLEDKLEEYNERFYSLFLDRLFFDAFAKKEAERKSDTPQICGDIPYLNGGLFLPHRLEEKYDGQIHIPAAAFKPVLDLFGSYSWTFNDIPEDPDKEINPEVLGYIFEKYINQKEFGAYYTPDAITQYLCQQTVERLVLDKIEAQGFGRYESVGDMLVRLNVRGIEFLLKQVLPSISLLDPACGSGAFLYAAMNSMLVIYTAAMGRIDSFNAEGLLTWRDREFASHKSIHYWLKKRIITDNLYGVDIIEEATEIAKLRLFMALVSSVPQGKRDQLEPLPNIDFNIVSGNSLLGLMRVEDEAFDKSREKTASLFGAAMEYQELIAKKNLLTLAYKHPPQETNLVSLRHEIDALDSLAYPKLNQLLLAEFQQLDIVYEEHTWNEQKNSEGAPKKRPLTPRDIDELHPFHWGYDFNEIFLRRGGFDAIITNPPWEVLQSDEKEFIKQRFDTTLLKNKTTLEEWNSKRTAYLSNPNIRAEWLKYLSSFAHQCSFYKKSPDFESVQVKVAGKRVATKLNLYYLFIERCKRLLRPGGLCGIVIPSGLYTDRGATGLRRMLFDKTEVTGLFGFENRREIFENVHRSYKFVLLSFRNAGQTHGFPATFMRTSLSDLQDFPKSIGVRIDTTTIRKLSPDLWSLMEVEDERDMRIVEKMGRFPASGDETQEWSLQLSQDVNMTLDHKYFLVAREQSALPVAEGKLIHQFRTGVSEPRYWIKPEDARAATGTKNKGVEPPFSAMRLAFRDVARNTDERTMIASIIPPGVVCGNTLNVSQEMPLPRIAYLLAVLNSFAFDSYVRRMVTAHCNMFYINATPIPRISETGKIFQELVGLSLKVLEISPTMASGIRDEALSGEKTAQIDLIRIRATIDAIVAHIYELTEEEFNHVLSRFPLVKQEIKEAALEQYRIRAKDSEDADQDPAAVGAEHLIRSGEGHRLEFKRTLQYVDDADLTAKGIPSSQKPQTEKNVVHSALKTICAFLNSEGGTLLIGVHDDGYAVGIANDLQSVKNKNADGFELKLRGMLTQRFDPQPLGQVNITFPTVEGKLICRVDVDSDHRPVHLDGEVFVRDGNNTIQLTGPKLTDWILKRTQRNK